MRLPIHVLVLCFAPPIENLSSYIETRGQISRSPVVVLDSADYSHNSENHTLPMPGTVTHYLPDDVHTLSPLLSAGG